MFKTCPEPFDSAQDRPCRRKACFYPSVPRGPFPQAKRQLLQAFVATSTKRVGHAEGVHCIHECERVEERQFCEPEGDKEARTPLVVHSTELILSKAEGLSTGFFNTYLSVIQDRSKDKRGTELERMSDLAEKVCSQPSN